MNEPTVPQSSEEERLPKGVPVLYADQVVDVLFGTFTSKLVLGLEAGERHRPTAVLVLPTSTLVWAAREILKMVADPAMQAENASRQAGYSEVLREIRAAFPSAETKDNKQ